MFHTMMLKQFSLVCNSDLTGNCLPEKSGLNHAIPGGYREVEIPVPIPNTEVKHLIANGTMRFAVWESRTLPGYFRNTNKKPAYGNRRAFFSSRYTRVKMRALDDRIRCVEVES